MRPRRLRGASGCPLNVTVRRQFMNSRAASALVLGLFFVGLGAAGLLTGKALGRWHIFVREEDPVLYWTTVTIWLGAGTYCLVLFRRFLGTSSDRWKGP